MSYGYAFPAGLSGYRLGADVDDLGQDLAPSTDSAGDYVWCFPIPFKCEVRRFMFNVTEVVAADNTAPVIKFWKNGTGGTLLDSITVPDATAVGKCMYVNINSVQLEPGDEILVELDVVCVDAGTESGKGWCMVEVDYYPEVVGNISNLVLSA